MAGKMTVKAAEDMIRELINLINVMKEEEVQVEGGATKIHPEAAKQLVAALRKLARKIGE